MIPCLNKNASVLLQDTPQLLDTPNASAIPVASTKRAYAGRTLIERGKDYATAHHITLADLDRWQWELVIYQNRPAFKFKTDTGYRYRFLDEEGGYKSDWGVTACLYGLTSDVLELAKALKLIIISNGEVSTVTGQTRGLLPVICVTSGEKPLIRHDLFEALKQVLPFDVEILIVYDCDPTGQHAGAGVSGQFIDAGYNARALDLGFSEGGDLADACGLYGSKTLEYLLQCPAIEPRKPQTFAPRVMPTTSPRKPVNLSPDAEAKRREHFDKRWNGAISALERTTTARWDATFDQARMLFDLVHSYGYESDASARAAIENASITNGYRDDKGARAVTSQINGALRKPRQTLEIPDFDSKPKVRRTLSARADNSGEFGTVHPDEDTGIDTAAYPADLPTNMIKRGVKVLDWSIVMEIRYLLYVMAHGILPSFFTFKRRNEGENTPPADKNVYTEMLDLGILKEVSSELILSMPHIFKDTWGKQRINSSGRKEKVYQLASMPELINIMFKLMARSLVAETVESDELSTIDESVYPLARYALEKLLNWKTPLESIGVDLVRYCLKKADRHRAEEVLGAIRWLQITDASLIDAMKLQVAQCLADAYLKQADDVTAGLIDLKNRLLKKMYQSHIKALKSPVVTPLPDNAPRAGKEGLKAFYNALIKPHNGAYLWPHELGDAMGIEDDDTAKRRAENAGIIIGGTRFEERAFTVEAKHDYTPSWEEVLIEGKKAIKHEDKALDGRLRVWGPSQFHSVIRSYNAAGRLVGKGRVTEADEPDDWRVGGTHFTIGIELRPLITVIDLAPAAAPIEETDTGDAPQETIETLDAEMINQIAAFIAFANIIKAVARRARAARRALCDKMSSPRVTPDRLRDDDWMLRRFIASFCFNAKAGVFYNPLSGEMHETQQAAIDDILSTIKPSQLKAAS